MSRESLPPLSQELAQYFATRADLQYQGRLPSALDRSATPLLMVINPIIVSPIESGLCIVAGARTRSLAVSLLPPDASINVLQLNRLTAEEREVYALADTYLASLYFGLSGAGMKSLTCSLRALSPPQRTLLNALAPGLKTNAGIAKTIGIRLPTKSEWAGSKEGRAYDFDESNQTGEKE